MVATLHALAQEGRVKPAVVEKAIQSFKIDPEAPEPREA